MKLDEMIELYVNYRQSLGEKFKTNAQALRSFMKYIGADTNPAELTIEQCESYFWPFSVPSPAIGRKRSVSGGK